MSESPDRETPNSACSVTKIATLSEDATAPSAPPLPSGHLPSTEVPRPMPTNKTAKVSNPADLLLRITRTPQGLHITSPQLPGWAAVARGPVPIAQAIDAAVVELDIAVYAGAHGQKGDVAAWDAAAALVAAAGGQLSPNDVVVVRDGAQALRRSGAAATQRTLTRSPSADRPATGKFIAKHDPYAWTDLGNGQWQSPGGGIYAQTAHQVQRVIAARAEAALTSAMQPTLDEAQAG